MDDRLGGDALGFHTTHQLIYPFIRRITRHSSPKPASMGTLYYLIYPYESLSMAELKSREIKVGRTSTTR